MKSVKSFRELGKLIASLLVVFALFYGAMMVSTITVIGQDTVLPEIDHTPVTTGWVGMDILITVNVTDNVEVDEVWVNYTNASGDLKSKMDLVGNNYTGTIPGQPIAGDITYFIWANDTSNNMNQTATYTITISVDDVAPEIDHTPVTTGWVGMDILITATVTDNAAVDEVWLNYTNVTGVKDNVTMTPDGDTYNGTIPAQSSAGTVDYFIWANDTSDNINMTSAYTIDISVDDVAPEIDHTPVTSADVGAAFNISATVTDNAAVDEVWLNYTDVGGTSHNETMTLTTGDTYNGTIPAQSSAGTVDYFIWANDTSDNVNMTDSYDVTIAAVDTEAPNITHDPVESATADKEIKIEATITDNVAVESATLYYRKKGETYTSIAMTATDDTYTATIPASAVTTDGVEYYISATDGVNVATSPATNPTTSPHEIDVTEEAEIPWLWIIIAIIVIIIIIAIVAAAARRKGPEIPEEEEAPPLEEEKAPEEEGF